MLPALTLLLICQLAGEALVRFRTLPLPGPVIGMLILFIGLVIRGGVPKDIEKVGGFLLQHLSLLFVPAGVGVMAHLALIREEWLPIAGSLIISTVVTIAVTALVMKLTLPKGTSGEKQP
ncbi:CidA/LrgA family protein [Lacibacterium aquatile]|uniref:CidA/LrgA family protein n=1 Tax=Lacibacterium aquatile TaxID=1168082 RepID=A0ABW5DP19_9PROT